MIDINIITTARKKEKRKALEDAINFLKLGVSEEIVAKGTGLSIEKVLELKKFID